MEFIEQIVNSQLAQTILAFISTVGISGALVLIAFYNKITNKNSADLLENTTQTIATNNTVVRLSEQIDNQNQQIQALTNLLATVASSSNISAEKKQKAIGILEGVGFASEKVKDIKDSIIQDAVQKESEFGRILDSLTQ
jgi:hypothetical protein